MPEISVVIPVYKVEQTLSRCVDSVLKQTFTDYEIILVDDGSPDSCGNICEAYKRKNNNIIVMHQPNSGLSAARNSGLQLARGNYVMFLDSDDYLAEDALEKLSGKDADLVIGLIIQQTADLTFHKQSPGKSGYITREQYGDFVPELLTERRINYVHGKLYRRKVITDNALFFEDDMLTSAEDTVFNFTFLKYCSSIFISDACVHYYMYNTNGLARQFYPDRYQRSCRLNRFLMAVSDDIGIVTDAQKAALYRYRIMGAVYVLRQMSRQTELSRKDLLDYTQPIYADEELRLALDKVRACNPDDDLHWCEELLYLLRHGSRAFVNKLQRQKRRERLKRCRATLLMYLRELLYRLHIKKR